MEYLSKVPEVKDSIKKRSLVHHLVSFVIKTFPDSTDLFSEFGAVSRCSKVCTNQYLSTFLHLKATARHLGRENSRVYNIRTKESHCALHMLVHRETNFSTNAWV